jgi:hypothetical protein
MAFSVALAIFWRMRGEVQRAGTIAPSHEGVGAVCGTAPPTQAVRSRNSARPQLGAPPSNGPVSNARLLQRSTQG